MEIDTSWTWGRLGRRGWRYPHALVLGMGGRKEGAGDSFKKKLKNHLFEKHLS